MKSSTPTLKAQTVRDDTTSLPPPKWWGRFVISGNPPQRHFVFNWGRILAAGVVLVLTGYLALTTALWGYYSVYRKITGVNWFDVVVLPRFHRVQTAMGKYYYSEAKQFWEKQDYMRGIITARAAVQKAPGDMEARLFLAGCWVQVARFDEALRTLKDGLKNHAKDTKYQRTLMETCLRAGRYEDLIKLLREDLPRQGVDLLKGNNFSFQLAEVQAVLETAGAAEAESVAARYTGLAEQPGAAPVISRIDWELNRRDAAFERLRVARERGVKDPAEPAIIDAYIDMAQRLQQPAEARSAAQEFLKAYSNHVPAQLRFLETHSSRNGSDKNLWLRECLRYLVQYRRSPAALGQLASLSASQGWTDLAYLLYQNSLQENLTGYPFVIYYVGSLVKTGDYVTAESIWRELKVRNSAQLASASYVEAMVDWGTGRESEALQIIERLRRETESSRLHRLSLEQVFRSFGFQKLADELVAPKVVPRVRGEE